MNCKPGDLAIMIYTNATAPDRVIRNIGRLCRVDSAWGMAHTGVGRLFHWNVTMIGSPGRTGDGRDVLTGQFPDKYLRPLPGEGIQEGERVRESVTA